MLFCYTCKSFQDFFHKNIDFSILLLIYDNATLLYYINSKFEPILPETEKNYNYKWEMLNARFYLTISGYDLNKFNFEIINNCCFGHLVLDGKTIF